MWRYLDKEHLLRLTLAVYKVTALFPEEQLKSQIRESANQVLADLLLEKTVENRSRQFEELLGFFDVAESKNWVDSRNFLVLRREYGKNSGKTVENPLSKNNHRQEKILEVINGNGKTKIGELIKFFPGINRRTVLRDLEKLCRTGVVARNGNGRGVYYAKCDMS